MTNEELRVFNEETKRSMRKVDYHISQAENFKRLYELTKNHKGIYKLLNIFAERRNRYHCQKGTDLAIFRLKIQNDVLKELNVTKEDMKKFTEKLIDDAYASLEIES